MRDLEDDHNRVRLFGDDKTIGLFVSLYLILLAFFILLSAVSQRAVERTEAAVKSVNATFQSGTGAQEDESGVEAEDVQEGRDEALAILAETFYNQFKLDGSSANSDGTRLEFRLPEQGFFVGSLISLTEEAKIFLNQIAQASQVLGYQDRLMASFFIDEVRNQDQRLVSSEQRRRARRMTMIAEYLSEQGHASADITTGFATLTPGEMVIALHITGARRGGYTLQRPVEQK